MSDSAYAAYMLIWLTMVLAGAAFRFRTIGAGRTAGLALIWAAIFLGGYVIAKWLGYDS